MKERQTAALRPSRRRWQRSRSYQFRVALIAGLGIQLGCQGLLAGAVSASPPSGYGDTDGGEGGFGGASNDAGFGNNPISSTTYSSDGNNDGFGPFGSDDNDRTPALSSSTAKVADSIPTPPGQEPAEPVHSYDEVGTNVLMANDQGFVAVRELTPVIGFLTLTGAQELEQMLSFCTIRERRSR